MGLSDFFQGKGLFGLGGGKEMDIFNMFGGNPLAQIGALTRTEGRAKGENEDTVNKRAEGRGQAMTIGALAALGGGMLGGAGAGGTSAGASGATATTATAPTATAGGSSIGNSLGFSGEGGSFMKGMNNISSLKDMLGGGSSSNSVNMQQPQQTQFATPNITDERTGVKRKPDSDLPEFGQPEDADINKKKEIIKRRMP